MIFGIILSVVGVLILIIFTLFIIRGNKLKVINLKITEAEKDVSEILKDKYNLLCSVDSIMKNKGKEDLFKELEGINLEKLSNIDLNKELAKFDKLVLEVTDYNKEIVYDETEEEIFDKLNKTNINRLAIEKYYNDNATLFNKLLDKFPSGIISKVKKYKEKELFSNEKEEIFEILKK